jgi:uncharacterized protein VirK/YbjX
MSFSRILTLLKLSNTCFPGFRPGAMKMKLAFITKGVEQTHLVSKFLMAPEHTALGQIMKSRPNTIGVLVWPYQNAAWSEGERLAKTFNHYSEIDKIGNPFNFDIDERLVLSDLAVMKDGLRIVLDQPTWFMREGGLSLNIFVDSFRAFTISFSIYTDENDNRYAVIGGIQGRNPKDMQRMYDKDVLKLYRELTKIMHGLRPRDFLIEVFRMLCRFMNVKTIYGIKDAYRYHEHPYFSKKMASQSYNAIWEDRGGAEYSEYFYKLPVSPEIRDISTIKAKKRSLYRKRYSFLEDLEQEMRNALPSIKPVKFIDT